MTGTTPSAHEPGAEPRRRRLDEMAGPGWVRTMASLFRATGVAVALLLLALGILTGSFFLLLTAVLAVVAVILGFVLARLIERESWYERPNARNYSLILLVGLPVLLVVIAQLAGPMLTPAAMTSQCLQGELSRDQQHDLRLTVDPRINAMELRIDVPAVTDGALRWWVTDPVGEIQWGGRTEEAGYTESAEPSPIGGQWLVSVRGEAAHAEYAIEWRGSTSDEPMPAQRPCE